MKRSKIQCRVFLLFLVLGALYLAGCASIERDGHGEVVESGQAAPPLLYCDRVDNGDDPETPGCHYQYRGQQQCAQVVKLWQVDHCVTSDDLIEYTDKNPHVAMDSKRYRCDAYCIAKYNRNGVCVDVANKCDGNSSSKCLCLPPNPPASKN